MTISKTPGAHRFETIVGSVFVGLPVLAAVYLMFFNPLGDEFGVLAPAKGFAVGFVALSVVFAAGLAASRRKSLVRIDLDEGSIVRNGRTIASISSVAHIVVASSRNVDAPSIYRVAIDVPYQRNFALAVEDDLADADRLASALADFLKKDVVRRTS